MYEILYLLERQESKFIFKSCLKNRAKRKVAVAAAIPIMVNFKAPIKVSRPVTLLL